MDCTCFFQYMYIFFVESRVSGFLLPQPWHTFRGDFGGSWIYQPVPARPVFMMFQTSLERGSATNHPYTLENGKSFEPNRFQNVHFPV